MKIIKLSQYNFKEIIKTSLAALKRGEVLLCPTDTVYGLLCDSKNEKAVEKIFKIKKRPKSKPLAVFVKDMKMAKKFAYIGKKQKEFLTPHQNHRFGTGQEKNWPGAVTVILKARLRQTSAGQAKKGLAELVYKNDTIGLRVPNYEFLNLILEKFKKPLAQTSANISGKPASTKIKEVLKQFKDNKIQPDLVINVDDLPKNRPSKVIDFTSNLIKVLRY